MKLVGALVYHSPTGERRRCRRWLHYRARWCRERFGVERRVIQHTKDQKYRERVFWQSAIFSSAIISLTSSTSSIPLFYLFFRGRSF